jgi:hypothetical protein
VSEPVLEGVVDLTPSLVPLVVLGALVAVPSAVLRVPVLPSRATLCPSVVVAVPLAPLNPEVFKLLVPVLSPDDLGALVSELKPWRIPCCTFLDWPGLL